jgi:effector-binding domain-containing protein
MVAQSNVIIKTIPAHIAYTTEFDIRDYNDFFDETSGVNQLQQLSDRVESENPDVHVPDIPNDYNYFTHEAGKPITTPMHVQYFDMVNDFGTDCRSYRFVRVEEVTAATALHEGPYEEVGKTFEFLYDWIREHGYVIDGDGRSKAIHGPWDREDPAEYLMEIQIPISMKNTCEDE